LGKTEDAQKLFTAMKKFAEAKLLEKIQIDYFATSLPLLLVFDEDLQKRNAINAKYLIALSQVGLGEFMDAIHNLQEILKLDTSHIGAKDLLNSISNTKTKNYK